MEEIRDVVKCIRWYSKNRFTRNIDYETLFKELCGFIANVLQEWTGKTYVGIQKNEDTIWVYQIFFIELHRLIDTLCNNNDSLIFLEKEFIKNVKYTGKIYRYLGHGDLRNTKMKIKPVYNDIFVSWSKEKENVHLESKLYGKTTRLYGLIPEGNYGIDIEKFQEFYREYFYKSAYIAKGKEREVVYPTIEQDIYNIEYI